jgi:hypothetical protein
MSSDPKPASLRDLYATPSSPWDFPSSSGSTNPAGAALAHSTKSASPLVGAMNNGDPTTIKVLKWGNPSGGSTVTANNAPSPSSFAGSSYATGSYPFENTAYGDAGAAYGYVYTSSGPKIALKALLASAFLQYTTTAIAMPWEVGKVLLQVQWVPKRFEEGELSLELELEMEDEEDNDELVRRGRCNLSLADNLSRIPFDRANLQQTTHTSTIPLHLPDNRVRRGRNPSKAGRYVINGRLSNSEDLPHDCFALVDVQSVREGSYLSSDSSIWAR